MARVHVLGIIAAVGAAGLARADSVQLLAGLDNTLFQDTTGALSNGVGMHFFVGKIASGGIRRGLIRFDVSAIPAGSTINSVSMALSMDRSRGSTSYGINMHRVTQAWGEGTSNAGTASDGTGVAATPGDATWLHTFHNTGLWTTPGGDFVSAVSARTMVAGPNFYAWSGVGLVSDVQAWVNGALPNYGWLMKTDETTNGTAKRFVSGDSTNTFQVPVLTVDYTVPAPGALGLVGVASLGLARRRR